MQIEVKAIYAILKADNTLQTLLGGTTNDKKIYPQLPNQFENFPCLTYAVVTASFRSVPRKVQDIVIQFDAYSKTSKQEVEDIYSRVAFLLNYYKDTSNICWIKQVAEVDENATDRQLWIKSFRFQVWSKNN